jgi:hypothetical protein
MTNKKLIFGIIFQILQLSILLVWGISYSSQYLHMPEVPSVNIVLTQQEYMLIFGGIMLIGMNILSIFLIINGMREDNKNGDN